MTVQPAVLAGLCLLSLPPTAAAQDSLLLRYIPVPGTPTRVLFQTHTRATDSRGRTYETADLGAMTRVPLTGREGAQVIHLSYDSVRVRVREGGGPWREFLAPGADSVWLQAHVDSQLRVLGTTGNRLPGVTDPLGVLQGIPNLVLPEGALRTGRRWRTRTAVPLAGRGGELVKWSSLPSLVAQTSLMLDSLVVREYDTLGYITVTGRVEPSSLELDPGEPRRWRFTGGVAGTLVWSTGWNVFVSGVNRIHVNVRRHDMEGRDATSLDELLLETTTRYQVRP